MDPFNIVVRHNDRLVGFSVHPKDGNGYMILFDGALAGEVFINNHGEVLGVIPAKELSGPRYPNYPPHESAQGEELFADQAMVEKITAQLIEKLGYR